jgi:hypothetical protein
MVNAFLDWLNVSFTSIPSVGVGIPGGGERWTPGKGRWGYDTSATDETTGMVKLTSSTRSDMGTAYVLSGGALEALSIVTFHDDRIDACVACGLDGGRASRVDLAIDVPDAGAYARRLPSLLRDGRLIHSVKAIRFIEGLERKDGSTTYLGSRKTSKFVRVYDKDAESNGEVSATRIEVQLGDHFAAQCWRVLTEGNASMRSSVIRGVMLGFVADWGDDGVNEIMREDAQIAWGKTARSEDATRRWLREQVAPTFAREWRRLGGDAPTWDWFKTVVASMMKDAHD